MFFWKTALRIFIIFGTKLEDQNQRKLTESDLSRKFRFFKIRARRPVSGPKNRIFSNFFKHRHVTPRWKTWGFRITKKIFLAKFGLLGRNLGPKSYFLTKFFKKKFFFQKFFIFDLSDSESKKGQKNDENFFSILQGSDTQSFLAKNDIFRF